MTDSLKPFALIPAYSHVDYRLVATLDALRLQRHVFHECSDLPKCRSQLLTLGLEKTDADVFLLVDSDMAPSPEQIVALLSSERLNADGAVTGAYVTRNGRCAFMPTDPSAVVKLGSPEYTECSGAGLGFAAVHRSSLLRLAETLPRVAGAWWPFCVPIVDGTDYYADDLSLWYRLRQTGTRLWLKNDLLVGHLMREARAPQPGGATS